jgi:hypothetical protein
MTYRQSDTSRRPALRQETVMARASFSFRSPAQLSAAVLLLGSASAAAQQVAPANMPISIPKPPLARQIEPMVAPVRRVAPKAVPVQQYAAPVATTPAAPSVAASAPVAPAVTGPVAATLAAAPTVAVPAAAIAAKAAAPQKTAAVVPAQKVVVHTCRIGQDYSDKLKSCVTAGAAKSVAAVKSGVSKVASAVSKASRKRPVFVTEGSTRSALGAKRN